MNMKRRNIVILSLTVAAVMLIALGYSFLSTEAGGEPRLTVVAPSAALSPGDEFEVGVVLENNPGIAIFCLWMAYDETRFEYVSVSNGPVLDEQSLADRDVIFQDMQTVRVTNGLRVESFDGDGELYTVRFRVRDDAASGAATFELTYRVGDIVGEPRQPGNLPRNFAPKTINGSVSI